MLKYPNNKIPTKGLVFRNKLDNPTKLFIITEVLHTHGGAMLRGLVIKTSKHIDSKHLDMIARTPLEINKHTNELLEQFPYLTFDPSRPHLTSLRKDREQFDPDQWPTGHN